MRIVRGGEWRPRLQTFVCEMSARTIALDFSRWNRYSFCPSSSEIPKHMPSKFESFLAENKINQRQLLIVSYHIESLKLEDRKIKLAKRMGAKKEGDEGGAKETRKPRSGRPINEVTLGKIFAGKPISGPVKTRVLRAVNQILERRKQDKVDLARLFDLEKKSA
jgi:hypothetical protein